MKTPTLLAIAVAAFLSTPTLQASPALADLAIPPAPGTPAATNTEAALQHLLKGIVPGKKNPPKVVIKDTHYILYGDLFHTHDCYALVQLTDPQSLAALALWHDNAWQLRGLWNIPITWRPKGWQPSDTDTLPDTPATKAFALVDLNGDGVPEVIIAGPVAEYYQDLYLLRFSAKDKTLHVIGQSRDQPINAGRYVVLYDKSPGHPIWGTWQYYQWSGDSLAPVAFWHDQVPFDGVGDTFLEATVFDQTGQSKKYHIVQTKESKQEDTYTITLDGQPYATITFLWRKSPDDDSNTIPSYASVERAYLYRKLTGLALSTYPSAEDEAFPVLFEKNGTVRVTGTAEAIKTLSDHSK